MLTFSIYRPNVFENVLKMRNKVDFNPNVQCSYDLYIQLSKTEKNNKGHVIFMLHYFLCNSRCKEMPEIASGSNGKI